MSDLVYRFQKAYNLSWSKLRRQVKHFLVQLKRRLTRPKVTLIARTLALALLACFALSASDDFATVYLYRLRVYAASKRKMTLSLDGEALTYLQNGRYYAIKMKPGRHVLSDKKQTDNIEFNVEAGQKYYLRAEFAEAGIFGFNTRFSFSDESTGKSDLRRLMVGDANQIKNSEMIKP
jgi:hypothetical protein